MSDSACSAAGDWKEHGIRIVRAGELDTNTPQTRGMTRAAAITHARTGAEKLWAGNVRVEPDAKTGAHHHGELKRSFISSEAVLGFAGATAWSLWLRLVPVISFTSHPSSRTRRSTLEATSLWKLSWCEAVRNPLWSTWKSPVLSRQAEPPGWIPTTLFSLNNA
jgi:hypothetical protein